MFKPNKIKKKEKKKKNIFAKSVFISFSVNLTYNILNLFPLKVLITKSADDILIF